MNLDVYQRLLAGESLTYVLSNRARWRLTGVDADRYLNGQVTCDVAALEEDKVSYAAVCTAKGRMEGDLYITKHGSQFYLDAAIELRESLGPRLEKYLIADDAALEDIHDAWSLSHIFGTAPLPHMDTGFSVPHARFGLPGYDVWLPSSGALVLGDSVDASTIETLRLEYGIPEWGSELTEQTLPPEAGPYMLGAISYNKGCYVGQETIARLKSVGHVNRTLVFLKSDSAEFPPLEAKLVLGEKEVGTVTSSGYSPRLDKGIALAYVPYLSTQVGTVFQTEGMTLTIATPFPIGGQS